MKSNDHKVSLSLSRTSLSLIVFLLGSILVSSAGFGLYAYQKLPQALKDIEKVQADLKDARQALQIDIAELELELRSLNSELPRSHVKNSVFTEHKIELERRLSQHERRLEKLE